MIVALHSAPEGFLKSSPPYASSELFSLVREAAFLGFKCFQVGPLSDFVDIDGKRLRRILDRYDMECNVHIGGLYDAKKFAITEEEYERVQKEIHHGIKLCREITSTLVSFHPPFFTTRNLEDKELLSKAKTRFFKLVKKEVESAFNNGIKMALETFCYPPFIFNGLRDFMQFVSYFPSTKLGVLLEVGHIYQAKLNLDEAVLRFKSRLSDIHVHDATLQEDFRKATHLPVGRGNIDFSHLIRILREVNYDGWLTLEIHGSEGEIVESKQFLENLIRITA
ncbi:TIM barrel protein [Candidatus Bathyarchaeota archaeon]|nr:TIM barrel protein [Candidatus Bathyarchaeota archaeon]